MNRVRLFKPHKGQQEIINGFVTTPNLDKVWSEEHQVYQNKCHWGVVVTGRQFGKTLLAQNAMLYWLLNNNNKKGVWASPYNDQGADVFQEILAVIKPLLTSHNSQDKKMIFKNGSTLLFRSLENYEAFRGYTFDYGVIDECAYVREEAWKVVTPTFAVHGKKVLVISTPYVKNTFHKLYTQGLDEENDQYVSFRAPSTSNPYFPYGQLEADRAIHPEEIIQQEYFAQFTEAGGGVFLGFEKQCKIDEFIGKENNKRCYIGVDIATGGKDSTVAVIMDDDGDVINMESWKERETSKQIWRLKILISQYNIVGGFIEENVEKGIAQSVQKEFKMVKPWMTTRKNKPEMIQDLKKDIEDGTIGLPTRKAGPEAVTLIAELGDFTKEEKQNGYIAYGHVKGGHDDTVIALALANQARNPNRYNKFRPAIGARMR